MKAKPVALVLIGIAIGAAAMALIPSRGPTAMPSAGPVAPESAGAQVWTCSMHPQVRLNAPGACPICSMPLVPAAGDTGSGALVLDEHAVRMASVQTTTIQRRPAQVEIRSVGTVGFDEARAAAIPSRVSGYLERIHVGAAGATVRAGDHLAEIYSPELAIAQQELLTARDQAVGRQVADAARTRLRRYGISDAQIDAIITSGKPLERLVLTAPIDGTVIEEMVANQAPVEPGMILYRVADLRSVWITLAIHEDEVAFIRVGQQVTVSVDASPGRTIAGRVALVEPVLDVETRTARARVVVANADGRLKPGMFAHATVTVPLTAEAGAGPTGAEGKWSCPMHPEVLQDAAGACPVCAMPLERLPGEPGTAPGAPLVVPATSVLVTGSRALVYRELAPGQYRAVEVSLGPRVGDAYAVTGGLEEGWRVVARGAFLIDSEAQIRGLPSLLRPEGGAPGGGGHQHGGGGSAPATSAPATGGRTEGAAPASGHRH